MQDLLLHADQARLGGGDDRDESGDVGGARHSQVDLVELLELAVDLSGSDVPERGTGDGGTGLVEFCLQVAVRLYTAGRGDYVCRSRREWPPAPHAR